MEKKTTLGNLEATIDDHQSKHHRQNIIKMQFPDLQA